MGFQVSPGVQVTEKDLTNVVPAVATSIAGTVIARRKGPCDQITGPIASEEELVQIFGKPNASNAEDWFARFAIILRIWKCFESGTTIWSRFEKRSFR